MYSKGLAGSLTPGWFGGVGVDRNPRRSVLLWFAAYGCDDRASNCGSIWGWPRPKRPEATLCHARTQPPQPAQARPVERPSATKCTFKFRNGSACLATFVFLNVNLFCPTSSRVLRLPAAKKALLCAHAASPARATTRIRCVSLRRIF